MTNVNQNIGPDVNGWYIHQMGDDDSFDVIPEGVYKEILKVMPFETLGGLKFSDVCSEAEKTKAIKSAIADKGSENNKYKIYGNGLESKAKYKNHEWLFDQIWYNELLKIGEKYDEEKGYIETNLELVLECEWGSNRDHRKKGEEDDPTKAYDDFYGEVKFDFQKLVVAIAKHRVMIFKEQRGDLGKITRYVKKQIDSFKMLADGSTFLCIAYAKDFKSFKYQIFTKHNSVN